MFIDFNQDGLFSPSEKLTGASIPVVAGDNLITFAVPADALSSSFRRDFDSRMGHGRDEIMCDIKR